MKKVSCIITSYKRDISIVKRALKSILAQTWENIEVLIIDDNRGEGAYEFSEPMRMLAYEFDKVRYFQTREPHGAQVARNMGIDNATGDYIAFLDDDDEWLPEKLEKQVRLMEENPEAGMCYCKGYIVDESRAVPDNGNIYGKAFKPAVTYKELLRDDTIGTTSQALIRREVFEKVGGFDVRFPARQDYEMWVRISRDFKMVGVDEPLFKYYKNMQGVEHDQISHSAEKCIKGYELLYDKYKADIDKDSAAKFNIVFHLAHFYRVAGRKTEGYLGYVRSFFTSPKLFCYQGWRGVRKKFKRGKKKK